MDASMYVEMLARMNLQERDEFVKTLVAKWPDLANVIGNMITLELMIKENMNERVPQETVQ